MMTPSKQEFEEKHHSLLNAMAIEELFWLNQMVVDRIKFLEDFDYLAKTRSFKRGDRVSWTKDNINYNGQVAKVNRKTIIVVENNPPYTKWKVDPNFLNKQ